MSLRRPRPRNTTDALVLATAFPHATRVQQDRLLFDIALRRGAERLAPIVRKWLVRTVKLSNESLRQPEVQAMARTLLGPHFARFGGEGLLEEILRAANDAERPEDALSSPPVPPAHPHEREGILRDVRRQYFADQKLAVCQLTLDDAVDPGEVSIEDLGGEFLRVHVLIRRPGTAPMDHTGLDPVWIDVRKPADDEGRAATMPPEVQLLLPGESGVEHLTLLIAQETAPAIVNPVLRPGAKTGRHDNVVPFKKPDAARPAAPPPSAG
jgi:hypothetical protein